MHPSESLRAVAALSEAALSVVVEELPSSPISRSGVAAVALTIQRSIMERVARASVAYGNYLLAKLHEAHADERRRISRELHDRVAHSIMVVFQSLELYEMYAEQDPEKARSKSELAKRTARQALKAVRDLSRELRDATTNEGLEVALSDYLRSTVPQEVRAWISAKGDESFLTPEVRDELYLILREAIRNAVAHSAARCIRVEFDVGEYEVRASVEDDGRGFDPEVVATSSLGMGLISMRERVALLGGDVKIVSRPGKGTKIEISVPLLRSSR
jgi:signal transduction histidine kinase